MRNTKVTSPICSEQGGGSRRCVRLAFRPSCQRKVSSLQLFSRGICTAGYTCTKQSAPRPGLGTRVTDVVFREHRRQHEEVSGGHGDGYCMQRGRRPAAGGASSLVEEHMTHSMTCPVQANNGTAGRYGLDVSGSGSLAASMPASPNPHPAGHLASHSSCCSFGSLRYPLNSGDTRCARRRLAM